MPNDNTELPRALVEYYNRIGAEAVHFRKAIIKSWSGRYYTEKAFVRVDKDGIITTRDEYMPTEEEQEKIKRQWAELNMPTAILATIVGAKDYGRSLDGIVFTFFSRREPGVIMLQQRTEVDGTRNFIPWTFWSDGRWRAMEPEDHLPFWKPERSTSTAVMIHEGAKAAMAAQEIATGRSRHPWKDELAAYEHWGMIGGALTPHRADYAELRSHSPTEVIYVADNDYQGNTALQEVSKHYGDKMKGLRFDTRFPPSWDMADELPSDFFTDGRYNGPCIKDMLQPATWATEQIPTGKKGRPSIKIKRGFAEEWHHSVIPEAYAHRDWPNRIYSMQEFNNRIRPFSDAADTAGYLKQSNATKSVALKYDPSVPPGIFNQGSGMTCLNTHVPSDVKPEDGDIAPFIEFMEHLVPGRDDRHHLMRWCATLIARPEVKMTYGVLLISEMQGVGKGTLGEKILAPLVGLDNVSMPSETEIVDSEFNYWAAHKRLAVVHEIYAGHSSKAYNKLKSLITDDHLVINKKYQAAYSIENWMHVLAMSNSTQALKLSIDDRRWFVPKVTELKKSQAFWEKFNRWLRFSGGLQHIAHWATTYETVMRGEVAPWSEAKKEVIEDGWSPGMKLVAAALNDLKEDAGDQDIYVLDTEAIRGIREVVYEGRQTDRLERPLTIRKVAKSLGWYVRDEKIQVREWGGQAARYGRVMSTSPLVEEESWSVLAEKSPADITDRMRRLGRF